MVVHELLFRTSKDRDDLAADPLTAGVRVAASEIHRRPVVVPERRFKVEQHFGIHAPGLRMEIRPLVVLSEGHEPVRGDMPEPPRAEVNSDPYASLLVREDIDVVVPAATRPELCPGPLLECAPEPRRNRLPVGRLEERVVGRCVRCLVRGSAHPEPDHVDDLVCVVFQVGADVLGPEFCTDRRVPTSDVHAHSDRAHPPSVRGHATDRHDVPHVPIRHQRDVLGVLGHALQLDKRPLVVHPHDSHLYPRHLRRARPALYPYILPALVGRPA